jgi:hypothetical protein
MAVVQAEAADSRKRLARKLPQIGRLLFPWLEMLALSNGFAYVQHMGKKAASARIATIEEIERSIHVIRGQRVMLDSDLAILYGSRNIVLTSKSRETRIAFRMIFPINLASKSLRL